MSESDKYVTGDFARLVEHPVNKDACFISDIDISSTIIILNTGSSRVIYLAILNKQTGEAVAYDGGPYFTEHEKCFVRGSRSGGSAIRPFWIAAGFVLEISSIRSGCCISPHIKGISLISDKKRRDDLVSKVISENKQSNKSDQGNALSQMDALVNKRLPPELHKKIKSILSAFSFNGSIDVVCLFIRAYEQNKLPQLFQLFDFYYANYWTYQAPEMRGDPLALQINAEIREDIYSRLDIKKTP